MKKKVSKENFRFVFLLAVFQKERFASVAQLVEQRTENPRVVGSIPTEGTISAGLAHLVERHLAKVEVASSSLVTRSRKNPQESPVGAVFEDFSFAEIFLRKLEIHDAL